MQTAAGHRFPLGEYFPLFLVPSSIPPLADLLSDLESAVPPPGRRSLLHTTAPESHVPPAAGLQLQMAALQGSNYFSLT